MTTYYVLAERMITSNTAEHGFGDYPEYETYVLTKVEADTLRKAQNAAKRQYKGLSFGGAFGSRIYTEQQMRENRPSLLKSA